MDRIELFRAFARVVEAGSFTKAAETLGLPRSSVSTAVQTLESRVGVQLLHRTTRKVAVTPDGAAFYERCIRAVADVDEVENLFRGDAASPSGRVRVDVPGRIGRTVLAPALPDFLARYPDIEVTLGTTDRMVNPVEENIDCVLRVGTLADSGLIARAVGELPLTNVASPSYLARHGIPRHPDDLTTHLGVNYASPSSGRIAPWEWVEDGEVRTRDMRARVIVNNAEAYIACCLAGLGLIQIPAYDVRSHLAAGKLVDVMPDFRAAPMPMTVLYPHRRHLSHRLRVFIEWMEAILKRDVLT
jgi:DNA-binding transcriptional LysR family regulator